MSSEGSIRSGIHLGGCQILGHLHSGATGEFWLALDKESEGRFVVCKVLQPWVKARRPDFVAALQQKVELARRLSHPNLVAVQRLEAAGETDFLVIEYVPGKSLERIRRGPPVSFALLVAAQLCEALEYLHAQTLTPEDPSLSRHLCLSPAKVILSPSGIVKLLGHATALVHEGLQNIPTYVRYARFAFYAPERLGHRETGPATDVYGVGAILYFLLTGQPPFTASSLLQLIQRVREGNPPAIEQLNPSVPPTVRRLIDRAMGVEPAARFASAAELRAEVREALRILWDAQTARGLRLYAKDALPDLNLDGLLSVLPPAVAAKLPAPPPAPPLPEVPAAPLPAAPLPAAPLPAPPAAVEPPASALEPPAEVEPPPTQASRAVPPEGRSREASPAAPADLFAARPASSPRAEVDLFTARTARGEARGPEIFPASRPRGPRGEGDPFATRGGPARPPVADLFAAARPADPPAKAKLDPFARAERESDVFSVGNLPGRPRGAVERAGPLAVRQASQDQRSSPARQGAHADPGQRPPPSDPVRQASIHFDEGVAALRRGQREAAIRALEAAVALDPENRLYRTNLQLLRGG